MEAQDRLPWVVSPLVALAASFSRGVKPSPQICTGVCMLVAVHLNLSSIIRPLLAERSAHGSVHEFLQRR